MAQARSDQSTTTAERHPSQWLALVIGVVYTLVGIAGFFVTGFSGFASPEGDILLGFEVNPLHNIVHLVIGILGIVMYKTLSSARGYGWILVVAYAPVFLYGLFVAGSDEPANFLALNAADNWLHAISALAGLAIAMWPARQEARTA